jgi:CRISPR system Cascade subunit CasC
LPEGKRIELCEAVSKTSAEELAKAEVDEGSGEEVEEPDKPAARAKDKEKPLTAAQFTKKVSAVLKAPIRKEFGDSFVKDAADIAIFGRMVATDHSLTVEGAGLFAHALSTHKAENDIDFFSAVDDLQAVEEAGAGMTGTLEFTSAVYYRYAALNLSLLFYQKDKDGKSSANLACFSGEAEAEMRRKIVDAFIRAVVLAVPGARKNSMNANTLPGYVLGLVKDKGQPVQLVNAFEEPVSSRNGLIAKSVEKLKAHHEELKRVWGIEAALEAVIPEKSLDQFCEAINGHV